MSLYPVVKAKFQEDLDMCKGYINEVYYLSQQMLVGMIMTQKENKEITNQKIKD